MAEKSRPKIKAAKGFAVVSDWSEHPDVKKAIASGNISAIEAATKKARDEGRNAFKPKNIAVPISELKEAYEASRVQEKAQEAARQERLESARTYGRRQQQAEIAKGQRRAREERAAGGYDATPTGSYGQPLERFWVGEAPPMPAPATPVPTPQVPAFPSNAPQSVSIAEKLTDKNYDFYRRIAEYNQTPNLRMMDMYAGQFWMGDTPLRGWQQRTSFNGTLANSRPLFPYWSEFVPRTNLYY